MEWPPGQLLAYAKLRAADARQRSEAEALTDALGRAAAGAGAKLAQMGRR